MVWRKLAAVGGDPLKRPLRRRRQQLAPGLAPAAGPANATSRPPATTPPAEPERLMTVPAVRAARAAERGVPVEDIDYLEPLARLAALGYFVVDDDVFALDI